MEYITLNNGIKIPQLGLGTYLLKPDDAQSSVTSALGMGYELIDTANAYVNERAVGRGVRESDLPRENVFLETKLWPYFYNSDTAVDETLERLDTPYIDLMILHQPAGDYLRATRSLRSRTRKASSAPSESPISTRTKSRSFSQIARSFHPLFRSSAIRISRRLN